MPGQMYGSEERRVIRVGVAGLGRLGNLHIANLRKLADAEIVAVYDTDQSLIAWKEANLPDTCRFASSYHELLVASQIDIVWIVTPAKDHASMITSAVQLGKHVFCEKPIGSTPKEAQQILTLSKQHRKQLIICGFYRRFDHLYEAAHFAILRDDFSAPQSVHSEVLDLDLWLEVTSRAKAIQNGSGNATTLSDTTDSCFYEYAKESGGIFLDCLIHEIDLGIWLLSTGREGDHDRLIPRRVWATGSIKEYHRLAEIGEVDGAIGSIEFWDGSVITLKGSRTTLDGIACTTTMQSWGDKLGVDKLSDMKDLTPSTQQKLRVLQQHWTERFAKAYDTQAKEVIRAVQDKMWPEYNPAWYKPPRNLTVESSVLAVRLAAALQKSLREGKKLEFDGSGKLLAQG